MRTHRLTLALGLLLAPAAAAVADEPRPVPLTRPEMKRLLEEMKGRTPRIPLPELTDEEKAGLDERARGYEGRLRSLYLSGIEVRPAQPGAAGQGGRPGQPGAAQAGGGFAGFGFGREQDPKMSLDYAFKTELFWIVSRSNNCQYCLGHQESKLLRAGLTEDEIAALDGDWSAATPARRAAYAYARKLTYEPHLLADADVDALRAYFSPLQILEMTVSIAGNNAINRWKEGVGVPQSANGGGFGARRPGEPAPAPAPEAGPHSYRTPTSAAYRDAITRVAPVANEPSPGELLCKTVSRRPPLESRDEVLAALDACRRREPRLPLAGEAEARSGASADAPEGPLPQWVRLLANFPTDGARLIASFRAAEEKGDLSPLLKAQVSWIVARQDRAWYATARAYRQLRRLGQTDDQVFALDGDWAEFSPADRALFVVARKLSTSPVVLTDSDVAEAVTLAGPRDVVQLVHFTTTRASFDRITEAAGLAAEE